MASLAENYLDLEADQSFVRSFGCGSSCLSTADPKLLGSKGANLVEMDMLGLPVPPGFTISTEVCALYYAEGRAAIDRIRGEVERGIADIEVAVKRGFGDAANPLLVSVRSGARVSMPGMMDTVLNLGLNDDSVVGLAHASGDERFAWDSYRRFIQMYADVVLGVERGRFEQELERVKRAAGAKQDADLSAADWRALTLTYKQVVERQTGTRFPQDAREQLWGAIAAVFRSWNGDRAKAYRRLNQIPNEWGTAVTVQAMVFGNMGATSATGVAFTRNPSTGERTLYGEYLINAQGEDVVAGTRTPQPLSNVGLARGQFRSLEDTMPAAFVQLQSVLTMLERNYRDMQDVEFTVERGKLWLLQTRSGKRTGKAAIRIAVDMVREGLITQEQAVLRVDPLALDQLLHSTIDPKAERQVIAQGLAASPGAACGRVVFDAASAERAAAAGEKVILVRRETCPDDIHGMHAAEGILTARGGTTSHAAVVARGMGRPCVSGAGAIQIDEQLMLMRIGDREIGEGDLITLDGSTGEVLLGAVPTIGAQTGEDFETLIGWGDRSRRLRIRTNAETPADCLAAVRFGAEGIGLCRTEHMFFDESRIATVREMIVAESKAGRSAALARLLPQQREDFKQIFEIMGSLPVTIRLLDPPLHEFLPHNDAEFADVAAAAHLDVEHLKGRSAQLREANPMLGHRGCRVGVTYPDIYEMQARAIFEAACAVHADAGKAPTLEIMVPLIATAAELRTIRELIDRVAKAVFEERGTSIEYLVGTMIELPRAALCAGSIAQHAQFFSFGTNDLTQTAFGISRDDAGNFLRAYIDDGLLARDPFVSIDEDGVGELVEIAVERGRAAQADIKLGVCGEHGGDPRSIAFFEGVGLDYVSASPYRVPIARLAAAQAAIRSKSSRVHR